MAVTAKEFRRALGNFATGVCVVTCRIGERTHGITVNTLTSVSLDPPLVLICIDQKAIAHAMIPDAEYFAVNILSERQREISDYFAYRLALDPIHELKDVPHHPGATGAPLVDGALAYLECRVSAQYPGGDHTIFLAEVQRVEVVAEDTPLLFHRGKYPKLEKPE